MDSIIDEDIPSELNDMTGIVKESTRPLNSSYRDELSYGKLNPIARKSSDSFLKRN